MKTLIALLALSAGPWTLTAHAEDAPRMRLLRATGAVSTQQAGSPAQPLSDEQNLPAAVVIQSVDGTALLESDGNATLRLAPGSSFLFNSSVDDKERMLAVECASGSLEVEVGGGIFRLAPGGKVRVISGQNGTAQVQRVAGSVVVRAGTVLKEGESLSFRESQPDVGAWDRVTVSVPSEVGFPSETGMPSDLRSAVGEKPASKK